MEKVSLTKESKRILILLLLTMVFRLWWFKDGIKIDNEMRSRFIYYYSVLFECKRKTELNNTFWLEKSIESTKTHIKYTICKPVTKVGEQ